MSFKIFSCVAVAAGLLSPLCAQIPSGTVFVDGALTATIVGPVPCASVGARLPDCESSQLLWVTVTSSDTAVTRFEIALAYRQPADGHPIRESRSASVALPLQAATAIPAQLANGATSRSARFVFVLPGGAVIGAPPHVLALTTLLISNFQTP